MFHSRTLVCVALLSAATTASVQSQQVVQTPPLVVVQRLPGTVTNQVVAPVVIAQSPVVAQGPVVVQAPLLAPRSLFPGGWTSAVVVQQPLMFSPTVAAYPSSTTLRPAVPHSPVNGASATQPASAQAPVNGASAQAPALNVPAAGSYPAVVAAPPALMPGTLMAPATRPIVVRPKVYVPGQPLRNLVKAFTP